MVNQVITIERKKYAVGLFWQPVAADQNVRNYARELARKIGGRLNYFVEYRYLVGLGSSKSGHHSGMGIAAAEVMEGLAEYSSFLAAFNVPEGTWIVAVRNGVILNDILFSNKEEAKQYYNKLAELPDWGSLIAPNEWGVARATEKQLSALVFGNARAHLRPLSRFRANLLILLGLLAIAAALFYFSKDYIRLFIDKSKPQVAQISQKAADEYKRLIEEKNKLLEAPAPAEPVAASPSLPAAPVQQYGALPDKNERVRVCWQAIGFLMQPIPGWAQVSAECGTEYAIATVRRGHGTLDDFYAAGEQIMPGVGVQEKSDSEVVLSVKLPAIPAYEYVPDASADTVMRAVNSAFQLIHSDVSVRSSADTVQVGNTLKPANVVDVNASSKLAPLEFIKIFENFNGVSVPRISWDAKRRQWNYEVKVYVE